MGNYELIKFEDLDFIEVDAIESRTECGSGRKDEIIIRIERCVYILPDGTECIIQLHGGNYKLGAKWYQMAIIGMALITASQIGVIEVLEREILKRTTSEWEIIN